MKERHQKNNYFFVDNTIYLKVLSKTDDNEVYKIP